MRKMGTHRLMTVKGARPASVMWRGHNIEQELRRLRVQYQSDADDLKQRIAALESELHDARGAR